MKRLESFKAYLDLEGNNYLAYVALRRIDIAVETGYIARLDACEVAELHKAGDLLALFKLYKARPVGFAEHYHIRPDGYAYAERFTGIIQMRCIDSPVESLTVAFDVTDAEPNNLPSFLTAFQQFKFLVYPQLRMDIEPRVPARFARKYTLGEMEMRCSYG